MTKIANINKIQKKILKEYNNNNIRKILFWIKPYFHFFIGSYYRYIHILYMIICTTIILFSNNIIYLSALLVIIITDVCSVVIIHDCPLTYLERKYLGSSFIKGFIKIIKKLGIHYRDIDAYEYQLEILGIAWTFVAFKILILILIKTFNIPYESHIVIY
jgi:hypothetical protein